MSFAAAQGSNCNFNNIGANSITANSLTSTSLTSTSLTSPSILSTGLLEVNNENGAEIDSQQLRVSNGSNGIDITTNCLNGAFNGIVQVGDNVITGVDFSGANQPNPLCLTLNSGIEGGLRMANDYDNNVMNTTISGNFIVPSLTYTNTVLFPSSQSQIGYTKSISSSITSAGPISSGANIVFYTDDNANLTSTPGVYFVNIFITNLQAPGASGGNVNNGSFNIQIANPANVVLYSNGFCWNGNWEFNYSVQTCGFVNINPAPSGLKFQITSYLSMNYSFTFNYQITYTRIA